MPTLELEHQTTRKRSNATRCCGKRESRCADGGARALCNACPFVSVWPRWKPRIDPRGVTLLLCAGAGPMAGPRPAPPPAVCGPAKICARVGSISCLLPTCVARRQVVGVSSSFGFDVSIRCAQIQCNYYTGCSRYTQSPSGVSLRRCMRHATHREYLGF